MPRYEALIKNVPENRWGVWDHAAQEWRETMLGTTDETDARQSAEVLNAMPDGYSFGVRLRIRRPPRVLLARYLVAMAFGICAAQLTVPANWPLTAPEFAVAVVILGYVWWKLTQVSTYVPDVHMQLEMNPEIDDEQGETQ